MIILVVQNKRIAVFEFKCDTPVAIDPYRPASLSAPFQRVKPEAGDIHILDSLRRIERGQLHFETIRVRRLNASQTAGLKIFSQTLVAK